MLSLKDCGGRDIGLVGGKAYWLGLVYSKLNVPPGLCISAEDHARFINNKKDEIDRLMKEVGERPVLLRKNLAQIRHMLLSQPIEADLINKIIKKMADEGVDLKNGVAVRSSAVNEDLRSVTNAGMYPSYLDVDSAERLEECVKNVWVSVFAEQVFIANRYEPQKMAVIIQSMVYGDKYGVMFSQDPNGCDGDAVVLEYSEQNRAVVGGRKPDASLRSAKNKLADALKAYVGTDVSGSLKDSLSISEKLLGSPVDMEWCEAKGRLHVLQVRPLIVSAYKVNDLIVIDSDNDGECSKHDLLNCKTHYLKSLGKKNSFRKLAKESGVEVYKSHYLIYNDELLGRLSEEKIKEMIPSGLAMVSFGADSKTEFCGADNLKELLRARAMQGQRYTCAHIGENIPAEISGYATLTKDSDIFIEYVPGGIRSLKNGAVLPTALLLKKDRKTTYIQSPFYEKIVLTSMETYRYEEINYNKKAPELSPNEIEQLYGYCAHIFEKIPNSSLEWYIYDGRLYAKDISFGHDETAFEMLASDVISKGTVSGKVVEIKDLKKLEELAHEYSPSLISHTDNDFKIARDPFIRELIQEIDGIEANVIIKAAYPALGLLPLLDHIEGMIFGSASFLCHVGIALRNKRIPALVNKEAYEGIKHLDEIILSENGIKILAPNHF